ncbi:DNA gyrase inhibitor YacG [Legionella quinlivanii]|uniref:DNA gyrase inhibitor YacG n=1 Tax=Legionella quinlivanii TaxID=45073 RepID=A0A364LM22_9GAMM|nr:DNA gyrase inhibitor YacG [Legionella quinlivanii]RAP37578.1 DNA gyrase inhibitor YacG [Legionella quinlivanii]
MQKSKKINCPICGKTNTWKPENSFRPFCSERCKLIDLGEWAFETRRIPGASVSGQSTDDGEDDFS